MNSIVKHCQHSFSRVKFNWHGLVEGPWILENGNLYHDISCRSSKCRKYESWSQLFEYRENNDVKWRTITEMTRPWAAGKNAADVLIAFVHLQAQARERGLWCGKWVWQFQSCGWPRVRTSHAREQYRSQCHACQARSPITKYSQP